MKTVLSKQIIFWSASVIIVIVLVITVMASVITVMVSFLIETNIHISYINKLNKVDSK